MSQSGHPPPTVAPAVQDPAEPPRRNPGLWPEATPQGVASADPAVPELRQLIQAFVPRIKALARRLATRLPPSLDEDDLVSVGLMGLMDAVTKYDPTRETAFKTYAEHRIRGAMLDEIRAMDWVPRSVHEQLTALERSQQALLKQLGRLPTDDELAQALGCTPERLDQLLLQANQLIMLNLEDLTRTDQDGHALPPAVTDAHQPDPFAHVVSEERRQRLAAAIETLPAQERLVLSLYYFEELTMKEIGRILKVTESRVCQIHGKAILKLKALLADDKP